MKESGDSGTATLADARALIGDAMARMTAKLSDAAAASRRWLETNVTPPPAEPQEDEEPVDPEEEALLERFAELERRAKKDS